MTKNAFTLVVAVLLMQGCSSAPKSDLPEDRPDQVLSRIDDLSSRPSWLKESEPFRIEDGNVISTGQTTIPGDQRVEAAYRISENNAKAAIAGAIEQKLEFIFQNAEENAALDTQARFIGAEASNLVTSSIRPSRKYWEKVATSDDTGRRKTIYRVFSTVNLPEADFRRAILDAARKREGKGGLSKDFADKVNAHWNKFVGAEVQPQAQAQPASGSN